MLLRIGALPDDPLAAAAAFHARELPAIQAALESADCVTLAFAAADHRHRGWRLAVVQSLAREVAPRRINALSGGTAAAIAEAESYLAGAPGVTGQLLALADAAC